MPVTVQDMMEARDRRAQKQRELLAEYGQTLLCFTMNIPGPEKVTPLIRQGFALGQRRLEQGFMRLGIAPLYRESFALPAGCEGYYVLPLPPLEAKGLAVDIEEADALGRLFDMDVLRPDGSKTERSELGLPGRACLVCGGDARACARSRTHSVAEMRQVIDSILLNALRQEKSTTVAHLACRALLYEVLTTPKPGLVDRSNTGSHRDMDVFTFASSTAALYPYFAQCALIGSDHADQDTEHTFALLRTAGKTAEGIMLEATEGINTHRGAIFSLGLLCAAAGQLDREAWQADDLLNACAQMTRGLTARDLEGLAEGNARTFGQQLYLARGITGIRGEAEAGFPLVRQYGLPRLEAGLAAGRSVNDAGCAVLLEIMAHNTDTNVIRRGGMDALDRVRSRAAALLRQEPWPSADALRAFDEELIKNNISPGGSADLLAMCYMLHFLKEAGS